MPRRDHRPDRAARPRRTRHDGKLELIAGLPLFAPCGRDALFELGRTFELCSIRPGTVLQVEGEPSAFWTVIVEGSALATRGGAPAGLVGAGDCLGERAVLDCAPNGVTVRALDSMVVLVSDVRAVRRVAARHPAVAQRLALSRRSGPPSDPDMFPLSPTVERSDERACEGAPPRPALSRRGDRA
jgi:hypothetical protein